MSFPSASLAAPATSSAPFPLGHVEPDLLRAIAGLAGYRDTLSLIATCRAFKGVLSSQNLGVTSLALFRVKVTPEGLRSAVQLYPNLTSVNLTNCCGVPIAVIEEMVAQCPGLRGFKMVFSDSVTDLLVETIARGCSELGELCVGSCEGLTDRSFGALAERCRRLQRLELQLGGPQIADQSFLALTEGCEQLEHLHLTDFSQVTDHTVAALAARCHQLRFLALSSCPQIIGAAFPALAEGCPELRHLSLWNCEAVTDAGITALAQCRLLEDLNLERCPNVADRGVVAIVGGCSQLRRLKLSQCSKITDVALRAVGQCRLLQQLHVRECPRISQAAIQALRTALPKLKIIRHIAELYRSI